MNTVEKILDELEMKIIKLTKAEDALVFLENNELQIEIYTKGGGYQIYVRKIIKEKMNHIETVVEEMWQEMKLLYGRINLMEQENI